MPGHLCYPRSEYPRPDRQRGMVEGYDWLNLNGPWQFRFDGERKGIDEKWFAAESGQWREQIIVPFCWESLAAWGEADAAGNDNYYSTRVFVNPLEVTRANHRSAQRYEVGWYRRWLEIPDNPAWEGKRAILTIGAADFFTDCWCNGVHLGHHEGGYTPFEFDLTEAMTGTPHPGPLPFGRGEEEPVSRARKKAKTEMPNTNEPRRVLIVLRVEDPMDNAQQPVGKQWRWYTTTSGIWQTVFIEPRSQTFLRAFRIKPDIDRKTAHFDIECANAEDGAEVKIWIGEPHQDASLPEWKTKRNGTGHEHDVSERVDVRAGKGERLIKIDPVKLWDPNTPHLYPVVLELARNGTVLDTVHTYFGMRKIDFELASESGVPTALRLNGVARYLRGALYQSYFPDGVYTATSQQTLKNDIAAAKRFGFNFLRVHIKVDDPILLYWADRLGILLMADFPNFGEGGDTALGRKRFEEMMRRAIERDFNHPSIFAWCLFNETWGFGGQNTLLEHIISAVPGGKKAANGQSSLGTKAPNAGTNGTDRANGAHGRPPDEQKLPPPQVWVQQMWELAKKLDTTRLVEDMSVCHWDHLQYYQHCDTDIDSWHFYQSDYRKAKEHIDKVVSSTFRGSSYNYVPGFVHKGQPLINSEYGGVGALDGDRDVSWSFKFLTNELRRHQQIAAYIYTELHDVEWEYNGFLNYDRTHKDFGYDPRIINESNALPIDGPPIQKVSPGETVRLEVSSAHFSTRKYDNVSLFWRLGGIDAQGRLRQDLARGRVPIAFPHRQVARAFTIEMRMPDENMLCTLIVEARTADGTTIAFNYAEYFVSSGYPPEREELPKSLVLRGGPATWTLAEWSGGGGDREKERAEDCCYGFGHGFFEWDLPLDHADLRKARRIKFICEASAHRVDAPQTDEDIFPTTLGVSLNGVALYQGTLRNHPHDARGVLSYWRGGLGAYGYLVHAIAEKALLEEVTARSENHHLRLRCEVPADALAQGGLTIYGAECGRFPVSPTVVVEW